MISNAGYATVMSVHILCAVIGFGALGMTGVYARHARVADRPFQSVVLQRYFRPGRNLAEWAVFAVPVLGGVLLVMQHGTDAHTAYPWIGLGLWIVATGFASGLVWPAERVLQAMFAQSGDGDRDPELLERMCRRIEWAGAATSICFVLALIDMIAQPF